MSEVPPIQPPQEPIQSNYPRQSQYGGTPVAGMADRCYHGGRAYFRAIHWIWFILIAMVGFIVAAASEKNLIGIMLGILIVFAGWIFAFYVKVKCMLDIAAANGMNRTSAILIGLGLGLVGLLGIIIVQFMAMEEIKKSGFNVNMFVGIQRKKYIAYWHELLRAEGRPPMKFTVWKDPQPL